MSENQPVLPDNYFRVPTSARIWNYWMGGKDNYPVDRQVGDAYAQVYPGIVTMAKESRAFLIRVVRHLAGAAGVRQFLDIGTGLPTMQNTHEVAQAIAPDAKIVYVDNDPVVLAHARALLTSRTPEGVTDYIDADFENPDLILARSRTILDFTQPIAVMFMGVLGHVARYEDVRSIVDRIMGAVPSGSYLVLWDGTATSAVIAKAAEIYDDTGAVPYVWRSPDQVLRCFEGLELVEPGFVSITEWRPEPVEVGRARAIDAYGALALKS
jgi:hypothetical protein